MLIVSHDRYFLDSVIERVFDLRQGRIETFPRGNYTSYRAERARRDEAVGVIAQRQQEEIERVEAYIRRYKEGNRATMAKSREKMLARLEAQRVQAPRLDRVVKFTFPACPPSGREVITLQRVHRAYADRSVLEDISLTLERGERVALIGPNGAGKSTLLRLLAGRDRPTRGTATLGIGVRPAYFAQDQSEQLDPANTVFDEVYQAAPASWDIQAVRDLLGRFLFSGDDQFKSVTGLSGGERSRVALAKLLLRPNNLLLLDEPTNHLDIATREHLEETLGDYPGTLVIATHDRFLVNRLANKVIEVADRGIRVYPGTYSDYARAKGFSSGRLASPVEPGGAEAARGRIGTPRRPPPPGRRRARSRAPGDRCRGPPARRRSLPEQPRRLCWRPRRPRRRARHTSRGSRNPHPPLGRARRSRRRRRLAGSLAEALTAPRGLCWGRRSRRGRILRRRGRTGRRSGCESWPCRGSSAAAVRRRGSRWCRRCGT